MEFKIRDFFYPVQIIKLKRELNKTDKFSIDELSRYQDCKLRDLINYSYHFVPYYRELFDKNGIKPESIRTCKDLSLVPVLTKDIIRNRFDDLTCNNSSFGKNRPVIYRTSGSTGTPLKFYHDKYTNLSKFVFFWRMHEWSGYRLGKRLAIISTSHVGKNRVFNYNHPANTLYISINKINRENSLLILDELIRFKCQFLRGYPSSLYNFLRLIEGNPKIRKFRLRGIITYAENLFEYQRKYIESVLNVKVYNMYSQWEHVCLGMECEKGNIHHQMEHGILEILDCNENVIEDSGSGQITATGFYNRTMPLIRYKIGDIGAKSDMTCDCGRQHSIISGINGRTDEWIITPGGSMVSGLNSAVKFSSGFDFIQIIQDHKSEIDVRLVKNNLFTCHDTKTLERKLRDFLGDKININFRFVTEIKPSQNGKRKLVINNIINKVNF